MSKRKRAKPGVAPRKLQPAKLGGSRRGRVRRTTAAVAAVATTTSARSWVMGVGASAGGFEATAALLAGLPVDCGMAIVIVQHLDPKHPSQAAALLARRTALAVEVASDGVRLEPNHVYTIPSDRDAYLDGESLRLTRQPARPGAHLPVDRFFRSLGETMKERAIGIVLSGTGSDGSLGLEAIAAHGGLTLVQEPGTAQYDGMPKSAIATCEFSGVLAVTDMPRVLCEYVRHPQATSPAGAPFASPADKAPFEQILAALRAAHSLDFSGYKPTMVVRRIERRMGLRQVTTLADYAQLVTRDPAELDALRRDLLIGVTGFFRDPEAWQVLERDVIDPIIAARHAADPVRVWVAGAATGEEAYSLAMALLEVRERLGKQCALQVLATDASDEAIAFARRGRYPAGIADQMSADRLRRFFEPVGDNQQYQVRSALRSCVIFGTQMLIDDPPFSRLDLISCRNVLMYLDPAAQRKVLGLLHFALRPGGFLFLGTAESVEPDLEGLRPCSKRWRIYQRAGAPHPAVEPRATSKVALPVGAPLPPLRRPARGPREFAATAEQILLERYCAAAFLVNRAGAVLYLYGRTEPYLIRRSGAPTDDLLAMIRPDLRAALRLVLRRVLKLELRAVVEEVRVRQDRVLTTVRMTVIPVAGIKSPSPLWLVILENVSPVTAPAKRISGALAGVVKRLEEELHSTQHDLRNSVDQMEASNQDIQASNEELVTVNEELQVANEELQSSKEELQSLNEELHTVNQQLQSKVAELETSSNDLENLLQSSQIITVCFDRELRVRWYSPTAGSSLKLAPNDIGRAMATFAEDPVGPSAVKDARSVLSGHASAAAEVSWKDRWYVRRLLPYRVERDHIEGVILTLMDITEGKEAALARLAEREHQAAELEKGIAERTLQLRELSVALTLAEERERRAVATDLHDDLGQVLALLKMRLDILGKTKSAAPLADELQDASQLLLQASDRVRSLAFQLSPTILYELGLVPALEWLGDEMKRLYSLTVTVDADQGARAPIDPSVQTVLFRAIRELLVNVGKHAHIGAAQIECRQTRGDIVITVADKGKGFDPTVVFARSANRGFGLLSIRERLAGLGGSMTCESVAGDGSRVTLRVPAAALAQSPPMRT